MTCFRAPRFWSSPSQTAKTPVSRDDARIPGALGSRPFDGEGLATRKTVLVGEGRLQSYLLDTYSARKLGLSSTHHAARDGSGVGVATTNLMLLPGPSTPEQLIASVRDGFYVTELIGFGVNGVTGDYSRGASGLWIEGGELAYPVEEVTVAGNLLEMFDRIEAIGDDLVLRERTASPTVKIARAPPPAFPPTRFPIMRGRVPNAATTSCTGVRTNMPGSARAPVA